MIAAANFTYLIGICMPNVAVWLLRRDMPDARAALPRAARHDHARRGRRLRLARRGHSRLPAVRSADRRVRPRLAYSGAALYAWRVIEDRRREGLAGVAQTLHVKLTGAMVLVLVLDGVGYLLAVRRVAEHHAAGVGAADIFVVVALLTISVGLVLPGMITYSATEVSAAAKRLTPGTLRDFSSPWRLWPRRP